MNQTEPAVDSTVTAPSETSGQLSIVQELALSIALNAGLGLFVFGSAWQLCFPPSLIDIVNVAKLLLIFSGLGLLAVGAISGLNAPIWVRAVAIAISLGLVALTVYRSVQSYSEEGRVLTAGRIEDGRWSQEELGLSFEVLPTWTPTVLQPYILPSEYDRKSRSGRLRLWPNERAIFFQMEHPIDRRDSLQVPSSIKVEVRKHLFTSLAETVQTILAYKRLCSALPGVRITEQVRSYRVNGIEFAEFSFSSELRNTITRSVFARSGTYLLFFILEAGSKDDVQQFQTFIDSIRIRDHTATFTERLF
jgi:hypothetical protein